jgi:hypothetical protein
MPNNYRLKNPEYREKERVKDAERKKEKYQNDLEYREKRKEISSKQYYSKKPPFRCCKTCDSQIEYKPFIVYCLTCYKKNVLKLDEQQEKVNFINSDED